VLLYKTWLYKYNSIIAYCTNFEGQKKVGTSLKVSGRACPGISSHWHQLKKPERLSPE
jgi:hypothetical protein